MQYRFAGCGMYFFALEWITYDEHPLAGCEARAARSDGHVRVGGFFVAGDRERRDVPWPAIWISTLHMRNGGPSI